METIDDRGVGSVLRFPGPEPPLGQRQLGGEQTVGLKSQRLVPEPVEALDNNAGRGEQRDGESNLARDHNAKRSMPAALARAASRSELAGVPVTAPEQRRHEAAKQPAGGGQADRKQEHPPAKVERRRSRQVLGEGSPEEA